MAEPVFSGGCQCGAVRYKATMAPQDVSYCHCRMCQKAFGSPFALTRFSRWSRSGVWQRVFEHLAQDADNEYAMIDSTIVRSH